MTDAPQTPPGFATLAIHAGAQPDPATGARVESPGAAPPSCPGGMKTSMRTRRSNGATYPMPASSRS